MRTVILALASAIAFVAPCAAQTGQSTPAVESAGVRPGEALICHYYTHEGYLVRRPICKTERQWVRARLQQQADVTEFQLRALTNMGR